MTTKTYLRKKNKLLREIAGIDFDMVPEDQIQDVEFIELNTKSYADMCPYCLYYTECTGCPMYEANNQCNTDENNTWRRFLNHFRGDVHSFTSEPSLQELVRQYNEEGM